MPFKYYIATGARNTEDHRELVGQLRYCFGEGMELTYDWTVNGPAEDLAWDQQELIAEAELEGVRHADVLIILWPGGLGTHCELGVALGAKKPVFLYTPVGRKVDEFCIFHHANLVEQVYGFENLHTRLESICPYV